MHEAFSKVWVTGPELPAIRATLPGSLLAYPMTVITAYILASPRLELFVVPAAVALPAIPPTLISASPDQGLWLQNFQRNEHQLHVERTDATRQLHLEAYHF